MMLPLLLIAEKQVFRFLVHVDVRKWHWKGVEMELFATLALCLLPLWRHLDRRLLSSD